ncbi:arylphorin subunit alpha-like isoform X5 [Leptidea sinapis]|uniref:arylphorin subunit alpha-like isoform X5 n=1 Tax=Leptidea sinapis TaxID=189913 RepID=UPI0021C3E90D|nr:arylphorin subunit alpha-like isoform X5 [Leptidea sinapis]
MKTVLVLASLVAFTVAGAIVGPTREYKTKAVDNEFVVKQQKVLSLYYHSGQVDTEAEYFKIGKDYNIEANIGDYTNQKAVREIVDLWKTGFLPKNLAFSIFNERSKHEAVALFHVLYYAKDFDVFYKTAAAARVYVNEGQFLYAYYIAVLHRPDTKGIVLPAPYEAYPELFTNVDTWWKINRVKMQNGVDSFDLGSEYGIVKEQNEYVIYANYSNHFTYPGNEHKISYFTEDIGLNAYYYYFHVFFPFWMESDVQPDLKEHRGEIYYYFYQQLLARYYLERLSSDLGEIPEFSWKHQIETGYKPSMKYFYNFVQRPEYYQIPYEKHIKEIESLESYETTFIQYLQQGHFKAYNQDIDLHNSKSLNFVGNFWQGNYDFFTKVGPWSHSYTYEHIARNVLGASVETFGKYEFAPTALDFYQSSVRDPIFFQLYSKILKYILGYKNFLTPYNQENLHYVGVKVNDVKVDKLVTYFDYYDFEVTNNVYYSKEELKSSAFPFFVVRQPRLNHKPFTVTVDVKSDVEGDAVIKIFLGPKYDSKGYPIDLEENWQNFVELDWSVQKLTKGQNKIERRSTEFYYVREDSTPVRELVNLISTSKVPLDMSVKPGAFPSRLLLPKGTKGGFPFQLFVVVYPYQPATKQFESIKVFANDNKPLGYPLDRPVSEIYFKQPNMFFEEVRVYHEGEIYPYEYNVPWNFAHQNEVKKHLV